MLDSGWFLQEMQMLKYRKNIWLSLDWEWAGQERTIPCDAGNLSVKEDNLTKSTWEDGLKTKLG